MITKSGDRDAIMKAEIESHSNKERNSKNEMTNEEKIESKTADVVSDDSEHAAVRVIKMGSVVKSMSEKKRLSFSQLNRTHTESSNIETFDIFIVMHIQDTLMAKLSTRFSHALATVMSLHQTNTCTNNK